MRGGTEKKEKKKEKEKEKEKVSHMCESIGHRPLRGRCPKEKRNKAGYTATLVAYGWAGAVLEKVTRASGKEPYAQKAQKHQKRRKRTNQPTDRPTDGPT